MLSTHATCWRQGRLSPDPRSALGWKGAVRDPSFGSEKPAPLTETQPVEIPTGKPWAEAPRGASLHPAPLSLPCRAA